MDPASLGLGAAALAIQIFGGAVKGFMIFEHAINADEECDALKFMLKIEYDRLVSWGEASGLLSDDTANIYDVRMRSNGPLVIPALSQLKGVLKDLKQTELRYADLSSEIQEQPSEPDNRGDGQVRAADVSEPLQPQEEAKNLQRGVQGAKQQLIGQISSNQHSAGEKLSKSARGRRIVNKYLKGVATVTREPKRWAWALREPARFTERLGRVQRLNTFLQELLGQDQMAILMKSSNDYKLTLVTLTSEVRQIKALLESTRVLQELEPDATASMLSGDTLTANGNSLTVGETPQTAQARFNDFLRAALEFCLEANAQIPHESSALDLAMSELQDLKLENRSEEPVDKGRSFVGSSHRWIEWKTYTRARPTERGPAEVSTERIQRLVTLLQATHKPAEFCVPPCLGYFVDTSSEKFGLVFEAPTPRSDDASWPPKSLLQCFELKSVSLRTRVAMAHRLSRWLMYLHLVNWLHKGLRSHSVLFFKENRSPDFSQLYVTGYEYSRVSREGHTTTAPPPDRDWQWYTHPDYLAGSRFRKTFDMYSLGIILIEIAYWQSIEGIWRATQNGVPHSDGADEGIALQGSEASVVPESDIRALRLRMLTGESPILDGVREKAGERYYRATRTCIEGMAAFGLGGGLNQADAETGADLKQKFMEQVVDCLGAIAV
ncbi:hypothetical protein LTR17_000495 [Elasticomyces elasticus]|nr:hypothetical protein LTR17_000495 [Elasticomyces elasticus]